MYLGAALTIVACSWPGARDGSCCPRKWLFLALLALIGLMGIDGINSYSHFFPDAPHLYEPQELAASGNRHGRRPDPGHDRICGAGAVFVARSHDIAALIENWRELAGSAFFWAWLPLSLF